jgi:hypothetical protein
MSEGQVFPLSRWVSEFGRRPTPHQQRSRKQPAQCKFDIHMGYLVFREGYKEMRRIFDEVINYYLILFLL